MAEQRKKFYFDQQDKDILALVNRLLETHGHPSDDRLFNTNLHPHGIKEMVATPVSRMAYAVINLLRNLEAGSAQARDRLLALQTLYDEVLNSAHSMLRRNTARVLMQIMKSMVRAHGQRLTQLKLAHDFRRVAQGTPRVVRRMLSRYHLPEMPEEWNQLAFDDHVYDANTKGRKTPTHLIMDAWIKGLRSLTVAYEYWVNPEAAREILRAAEITGISVRIGLEFQVPFYHRYASLLWIPRGFSCNEDFLEFLHLPKVANIMARGREVLQYRRERVLRVLASWNTVQRPQLEEAWGVEIAELTADAFLRFVGRGQASGLHLSECLHQHMQEIVSKRVEALRLEDDEASLEELHILENFGPDYIADHWLNAQEHPEMPDLNRPMRQEDRPPLLQLTPQELSRELLDLNPGYRLVLGTADMTVVDVAEFLWDCRGAVTHLEIFNMKGWMEGKQKDIRAIGELQRALNMGLGPRIKQMVRQMIQETEESGNAARAAKLRDILHNVPKLWEHYRHSLLKSRLGTSSASRRSYGMGLVLTETLPRRAMAELKNKQRDTLAIPIYTPVEEHVTYRQPESPSVWQRLGAKLRFLPGCRHLGMEKRRAWSSTSEDCRVCCRGNVANLGGLNLSLRKDLLDVAEPDECQPDTTYLNSTVSNCLKVLLGFIPAFFSFLYTQDWWVLAWLGTFIWFGITGVRNVVQMVLAAKGATRDTLIHWKEQVSINRLCDSLMYTGISVLLLEVLVRVLFLEDALHVTVTEAPLLVFTVLNVVNGLYIFSHNIFRGFPRQAAIGNLFRSVLGIPIASLYNFLLYEALLFMGVADVALYLEPSAAIISKLASDTVAAVIEGYADSKVNMRMRRWDYTSKFNNLFSCYTRLELLFPQEAALINLARPGGLGGRGGARGRELERAFIINALDLMYFWFYQPRAQEVFRMMVRAMPEADRNVLIRAQLVLMREREISQMLVDGLLGRNFSRPLAFFLDKRKQYLRGLVKACRQPRYKHNCNESILGMR